MILDTAKLLKEQRENFLSSESGDTARDLFEEWITLELATVYTDEQRLTQLVYRRICQSRA